MRNKCPRSLLCILSSHPLIMLTKVGEGNQYIEGFVTLLSCSQGLKSVDRMCTATEQPGSLSSQAGRSEGCQRFLAPSPRLMLSKSIVWLHDTVGLLTCACMFLLGCVHNSETGLRLSKALSLVGNLDQHVTEHDNFHNGF